MTTDTLKFLPAQLLPSRKALCFSNIGYGRNGLKAQEMPPWEQDTRQGCQGRPESARDSCKVKSILPTCKNTAYWAWRYYHLSAVSPGSAGRASPEPIIPENNLQSKSNDSFPNGSKGSLDLPDQEMQCVFMVTWSVASVTHHWSLWP